MTLHAFASDELLRDPERKTASTDNAYVTALLKVDADTVVSLTAFDATLAERLAALRKGSSLAVSGRLQARPYQDQDGTLRAVIAHSPSLAIPRGARSTMRCRNSKRIKYCWIFISHSPAHAEIG